MDLPQRFRPVKRRNGARDPATFVLSERVLRDNLRAAVDSAASAEGKAGAEPRGCGSNWRVSTQQTALAVIMAHSGSGCDANACEGGLVFSGSGFILRKGFSFLRRGFCPRRCTIPHGTMCPAAPRLCLAGLAC